jgi:HEPN domain-containing protein
MKRERFTPDDPREWLNRARSNLIRAASCRGLVGVYLEDACFDAQQAAEKAIKAVLLSRSVEFPWTHDLGQLLDLARQATVGCPGGRVPARSEGTRMVSGERAHERDP